MDLFSIISGFEDIERSYLEAKKLRDDASLMIDKLSHGMGIYTEQLKELPGKISLLNERKSLARDSWEIENGIYEASVLEKETFLSMHSKESFLDSSALSERQSKTVSLKEEIKKLFEKHGEWKKSLDDTPKPEPELFDLVNGLNEKIREAEYQEDFANHIKEENKRLMVVIQERLRMAECARDGKCDSCGQILPEIERQGSIMKQINLAKESEAQIKEIPEIPDLKTLYLALDSAKQKFDDRRAELSARPSQIKAEMQIIESGIQAKYSEQKQIDAEISAINDRASQAFKDKVSALDGKIKNIEIDKVRAESNWKGFKDSIEEAESQKENLEKKIKETSTLISDQTEARSLYSDLMTVFGPKGYRSICFDGLVARIGKRAGEIMEIMTQSIYSTYLNQVSEDSKGNMKLILKPTVLCRGKEVPKDFLSGGLEDRISLAYDVSISEAAGDGLPLLLDEVLSALDDVGKAEAMVLLETISKTRPVLVIDHASEFKAMFTNTIKVTYENEESVLSM
jgi:ABC-type dipeptide/oligopeptide/nickel transport system ATPase component